MFPVVAGAVVVGVAAAAVYWYRNSLNAPAVPPKESTRDASGVNPAFQPTLGVSSLVVTLGQDVFGEVAKLIQPIAEATVLEMKVADQKVSMAHASNIKITNFDIKDLIMDTEDGFLNVVIDDVEFKVGLDLKIALGKTRPLTVAAVVDISSKIDFYIDIQDKKVKSNVFDTKINIRNFDAELTVMFGESLVNHAIDLVENILKKSIEESLDATVTSSLQSGLDSVLARNWDIQGAVSRVAYNCGVEFLGNPVITKKDGVQFNLGIDIAHEVRASAEAAAAAVTPVVDSAAATLAATPSA
ncbi:UNVERIFIED_CONTAM: hypothetical protein HDU68_000218 [Siphonaria sp. JEL0065]|nr:hypothetical protein HDU68_000218 [Siphonaria sp. JEL0065]